MIKRQSLCHLWRSRTGAESSNLLITSLVPLATSPILKSLRCTHTKSHLISINSGMVGRDLLWIKKKKQTPNISNLSENANVLEVHVSYHITKSQSFGLSVFTPFSWVKDQSHFISLAIWNLPNTLLTGPILTPTHTF